MSVRYEQHPPGIRFTESTVRTVARLANEHRGTWPIRKMATSAVQLARVPDKDTRGELEAIYDFVTRRVRYTKDPTRLEWVQSPTRTLSEGVGDCDDIACCVGALAGSIGIPVRYVIGGPAPGAYSHIWAEGRDRHEWIPVDPVLRPRLGFGDRPGARSVRIFDDGGRPMHGRQGLSGPVSAAQATLWETSPLFNSWDLSGADLPHTSEIEDPEDGDLALGDDGELMMYDGLSGFWNTLKKIGKVVSSVAKFIPIPGVAAAMSVVDAGLKMIPDKGKPNLSTIARGAAAMLPGEAGRIARTATGALLPRGAARPGARAALPRGTVSAGAPPGARAPFRASRPAQAAARPELARRYPPDARQLFDAATNQFRVFLPTASSGALSGGMGADPIALAADRAIAAIRATRTGLRRAIPAVRDFQRMVPGAVADGLYGPNTRAALIWAIPSAASTLPPAAFPGPVTWVPQSSTPTTPAAAPAAPPAPRGAVYRDASGTPRATGYTEVAQERENPGLAPMGFQPPPPEQAPSPPVLAPSPATSAPTYDAASSPSSPSSSGGLDSKTIGLLFLALYVAKRRKK